MVVLSLASAAEAASQSGGVSPVVVGVSVFVLLTALMAGLLFFGAGRDHT